MVTLSAQAQAATLGPVSPRCISGTEQWRRTWTPLQGDNWPHFIDHWSADHILQTLPVPLLRWESSLSYKLDLNLLWADQKYPSPPAPWQTASSFPWRQRTRTSGAESLSSTATTWKSSKRCGTRSRGRSRWSTSCGGSPASATTAASWWTRSSSRPGSCTSSTGCSRSRRGKRWGGSTSRNVLRWPSCHTCQILKYYLQFCGFAACLKPVLSEELTVMSEIENIGEVVDNLAAIIRDPHVIPETTDQVIRELIIKWSSGDLQVIEEIISSGNAANYSFATPPSSPGESLFSSRCGSLKSIRCKNCKNKVKKRFCNKMCNKSWLLPFPAHW